MDDEEQDVEYSCPSYPWSWKSAAVYCGDFVSTVFAAASQLVEGLSVQMAAAVNHDVQRREFREAVARDLESLNTLEE